ncbi:MAG: carbohydrate-binding domain-containing protein, partial [Prevotella sp.]|nr:carbohydrate-binding domain-containing protein [Prevotella sp.]
MKQVIIAILTLASFCSARAQMLNVETADGVTYKFPAAQAGDMTYNATGDSVTIMNKRLAVSDITAMKVDDSSMSDDSVSVVYDGASAKIYVAGNIAQYLTPAVSGAHVNIAADKTLAREITYNLSGTSTDGEFYMSGSYKATVELDGLTLKNQNPVTSGAAVHIQNGKRIDIKVISGTTNTLEDAATGSQKGCLYVKGHAEFKQKGTLNVIGNVKHGIKIGEYMTVNKATINVTSAVGDGISCSQYFLMESGEINISGTGDDGIQCELDGETAVAASDDQHTDEDTGSFYLEGGQITVSCDGTAVKCIKGDGDFNISGDAVLTATTTGDGKWDTEDLETKAASCISVDGNMNINGGAMSLTSTGSGGAGMKCDGVLTVNSSDINIKTTGGLYYNNGSTENLNYTGDTDRVSSNYYSSPKGIKAGTKTESGNT